MINQNNCCGNDKVQEQIQIVRKLNKCEFYTNWLPQKELLNCTFKYKVYDTYGVP